MKEFYSFIKKSLFFFIGFCIITFLLQYFLFFLTKNIEVGDFGVLNKINKGSINADILISGTSRAFKGINPNIIENYTDKTCFNIATDGVDLGVQIPKIKWYLTHNKNPKILIQDISQFGGAISRNIYEPFKYLPYLYNDSLYSGLLKINRELWKNKYLFPYNLRLLNFDFYVKILNGLINSILSNEKLIKGHSADKSKWATNLELLKRKFPNGIDVGMTPKYKKYINELIKICAKRNIKLIFITIPNYYEINKISKNNEEIINYYNTLSNFEEVYFNDCSNIAIARNTDNFYNFTHLNENGSIKFSKLLSKELVLNLIN